MSPIISSPFHSWYWQQHKSRKKSLIHRWEENKIIFDSQWIEYASENFNTWKCIACTFSDRVIKSTEAVAEENQVDGVNRPPA